MALTNIKLKLIKDNNNNKVLNYPKNVQHLTLRIPNSASADSAFHIPLQLMLISSFY